MTIHNSVKQCESKTKTVVTVLPFKRQAHFAVLKAKTQQFRFSFHSQCLKQSIHMKKFVNCRPPIQCFIFNVRITMTQIGGTGVYEDLKSEYAEIKTK